MKRCLIVCSILLLTLFCSQPAGAQRISYGAAPPILSISRPGDGPFNSAVASLTSQGVELSPDVLTYSVALTNASSQDIVALAVDWMVTSAAAVTDPVHRATARVFSKTATGFGLRPGQTVVVSPLCMILSASPKACPSDAAAASHIIEPLRSGTVTVGIDGVVTRDGTFTGPNYTRLYERLSADISADKVLAQEMITKVQGGTAPSSIGDWLKEVHSTVPGKTAVSRPGTGAFSIDWEGFYRARAAGLLADVLSQRGEQEAVRIAASIMSELRLTLRKGE